MKRPLLFVTLVASLMLFATPANAQTFGVRAGASADPDQFFFGGHYETKPLMKNLTFRPNIEVGVGDDVTLVAFNIEFAYWIDLDNKPWKVYLGGGPAAILSDKDDNTDFNGGFNLWSVPSTAAACSGSSRWPDRQSRREVHRGLRVQIASGLASKLGR